MKKETQDTLHLLHDVLRDILVSIDMGDDRDMVDTLEESYAGIVKAIDRIRLLSSENHRLKKLNTALKKEANLFKQERDMAVRDCACFPCATCAEKENGDHCSWCTVVNGCRTGHVYLPTLDS